MHKGDEASGAHTEEAGDQSDLLPDDMLVMAGRKVEASKDILPTVL